VKAEICETIFLFFPLLSGRCDPLTGYRSSAAYFPFPPSPKKKGRRYNRARPSSYRMGSLPFPFLPRDRDEASSASEFGDRIRASLSTPFSRHRTFSSFFFIQHICEVRPPSPHKFIVARLMTYSPPPQKQWPELFSPFLSFLPAKFKFASGVTYFLFPRSGTSVVG